VGLVAALTDRRNQAPKGNAAPLLIGLVVAVIGLAYGTNAGYAVNPARDFGPRMFTWALGWGNLAFPGDYGAFHGYWWIPIAGPLAGGLVGIILYDFFIGQVLGAREKAEKPPEPGRVQGDATAAVPAQRGSGNTGSSSTGAGNTGSSSTGAGNTGSGNTGQGETPCSGTGTTSARSSST
ncbi:MAG TPA: aquaporin, partial [Trebonia sp.]